MIIEIFCETDEIAHTDRFSGTDPVKTTRGERQAKDIGIGDSIIISRGFSLKVTRIITYYGDDDGCEIN